MFLQNYWYVAAWDYEVAGKPLGRTICGEKVVLYRTPDRSVVALEDCCPHRLLPLSSGFVKGDNIVCGYHGLEFDCTGACTHMPNQETIHPKATVIAYPVIEKHRFVWVWIGDADKADESLIPAFDYLSSPEWCFDGGYYPMQCNAQLLVDNLMDLTHETYVHPSSIGQHEITETPIKTSSDEHEAVVSRWMNDIPPPPFWAHNLKSTENVDRWQIGHFSLPANVMIDVGVAPTGTGAPQGDRSKGVSAWVVDLMTPETETTCHYFWGFCRDFEIHDEGLTLRIKDGQGGIFAEDLAVLEAQQNNILERPDRSLINFNIDAGGVLARRLVDRAMKDPDHTPKA